MENIDVPLLSLNSINSIYETKSDVCSTGNSSATTSNTCISPKASNQSSKTKEEQQVKKQYVLKTCRFVDRRCQQLPSSNIFLTCLDILILDADFKEDCITPNRFLSSFNYFKRVSRIERRLSQDWIKIHLSYVTMKKIPVKVLQQRLKSTKTQAGSEMSDLLENKLLEYNRFRKHNNNKKNQNKPKKEETKRQLSAQQLEEKLTKTFCYVLEIENTSEDEQKMDRMIYDFNVTTICFSELLCKLIAGSASNLVSYVSAHGIPEIYSENINYYDFWQKRLIDRSFQKGQQQQTANLSFASELKTLENNYFHCQESVQYFTSKDNPSTLLVVVSFELPLSAYKLMHSERQYLGTLMQSLKPQQLEDQFIVQYAMQEDKGDILDSSLLRVSSITAKEGQ